jgi:hypothetical protein
MSYYKNIIDKNECLRIVYGLLTVRKQQDREKQFLVNMSEKMTDRDFMEDIRLVLMRSVKI